MNKFTCANRACEIFLGLVTIAFCARPISASDWPRFHGADGNGTSLDTQSLPVTWSEKENLRWKCKLPGPGASSPIVVGRRVFVTCWTGYGVDPDNEGNEKDLRRHLICLDRDNGSVIWDESVAPVLPEDPYSGNFTQHGYASHTPVSDGQRVYVFFGKTGVLAFDLNGRKLWQTGVGAGSGPHGWGSASSLILYKNFVIVMASAESESLVALDKETGKEVWRRKDAGFSGTWGTPILVDCGQGRTDLVIAVPHKIWGFDPDTGKLRWQCDGLDSDSICSSAIAHDGIVYVLEVGPRGGGNMAVRAGGEGDVSKTHLVWRGVERTRIDTPVLENGRIYFVSNRAANCLDAASGKSIYKTSLTGGPLTPEPTPGGPRPDGGRPGDAGRPSGGRPGGGRSGMRGQDYSSPIFGDGKIYFLSRSGNMFVYATGPKFKLLGQNCFASDGGDFSSTPAISDGQLFIRSSKYLYCVADLGRR